MEISREIAEDIHRNFRWKRCPNRQQVKCYGCGAVFVELVSFDLLLGPRPCPNCGSRMLAIEKCLGRLESPPLFEVVEFPPELKVKRAEE